MRGVIAIVLGYVIFAGSAVALFWTARVDPHAPVGLRFMAFSIAYGLAFAAAGGYVAGWIGKRRDSRCGLVLVVVVGMGAASSMIATPGASSRWSQIAALVLFTPAAWAGDWLRLKVRTPARLYAGRRA